jgi:hypothetical protein
MNIEQVVKHKAARIQRYSNGVMCSTVGMQGAMNEQLCLVQIGNIGDATLDLSGRAVLRMRHIRTATEDGTRLTAPDRADSRKRR